jgi:hypothetical protein
MVAPVLPILNDMRSVPGLRWLLTEFDRHRSPKPGVQGTMQTMPRKAMLSCLGLCLACSHPLGSSRSRADATDVSPDGFSGQSGDAPIDMAGSQPDVVDSVPDIVAGGSEPGAGSFDSRESPAEAAMLGRDGFSSERADVLAWEVGNPWSDAGWIIDGPCSDNPSNLMQILATSVGRGFCSRTASSQYEGYINFDSEGRVILIVGYPAPVEKQAWVDSLAAYRWPCLANQTVLYGCSL